MDPPSDHPGHHGHSHGQSRFVRAPVAGAVRRCGERLPCDDQGIVGRAPELSRSASFPHAVDRSWPARLPAPLVNFVLRQMHEAPQPIRERPYGRPGRGSADKSCRVRDGRRPCERIPPFRAYPLACESVHDDACPRDVRGALMPVATRYRALPVPRPGHTAGMAADQGELQALQGFRPRPLGSLGR